MHSIVDSSSFYLDPEYALELTSPRLVQIFHMAVLLMALVWFRFDWSSGLGMICSRQYSVPVSRPCLVVPYLRLLLVGLMQVV